MAKIIKSIFDKSYIVKAQAEAAGAKEWPQGMPADVSLSHDVATKKFRFIHIVAPLVEWDESNEAAQARVQALKDGLAVVNDIKAQATADKQANASMGLPSAQPRLSTAIRPTKLVWEIADQMPKATRKEVMAACVAAGVAYGTARTQYQAWFKASQDAKREDIRQPYQKGE